MPALIKTLVSLGSRKFIVWMVGSVAMFTGFISANDWMIITGLYLSAQTVVDFRKPQTPSISTGDSALIETTTTTTVSPTPTTSSSEVHTQLTEDQVDTEPTHLSIRKIN